jgi:beta-lactamase regulating signal transducer with metallopeptidase domain/protocatechuate 3,4-dioxygenase beta subunit
MTWDLLAEGSKALAEFGLTWLCQSSALLATGLLAGRMLRRSGPAVQSAIYRTALAAVFICPVASVLLAKAGFDGVVLRLPVRTDAIEGAPTPIRTPVSGVVSPGLAAQRHLLEDLGGRFEPAKPAVEAIPPAAESPATSPPPVALAAPTRVRTSESAWLAAGVAVGLVIWGLGASLMVLRLAVGIRQMVRLRAAASRAEPVEEALCLELARRMSLTAPAVLRTPFLHSPCVDGLRKTAILLPDDAGLDLRDAFVHELAHLARRDVLWNLLRQSATALLWFQPLLWALSRRMEVTAEEVCDDYVVQFGADRASYAGLLLELAGRTLPPVAPMAVGMVSLRSLLARRVVRILDTSRALSTRVGRRGVAATLAAGLGGTMLAGMLGVGVAVPRSNAAGPDDRGEKATTEARAESGRTRTVTGRVVDPEGRPIAGATVTAARFRKGGIGFYGWDADRHGLERVTTDGEGRFTLTFDDIDPASFERPTQQAVVGARVMIVAGAGTFGPAWVALPRSAGNDRTLTLTLARDDVPIEGRVIDLEGRPVAGASAKVVLLYRAESPEAIDRWRRVVVEGAQGGERPRSHYFPIANERALPESEPALPAPVKTDADGRFRIEGLGRDRLAILEVSGPSAAFRRVEVVTRRMGRVEGRHLDDPGVIDPTYHGADPTIIVEPSRPIEGVVRDAATQAPIPYATITAEQQSGQNHRIDGLITVVCDSSGRYRLIGLPKGNGNRVGVYPPADRPYFVTHSLEVPDGPGLGPVAFDIELRRGIWITGRVIDAKTGAPVASEVLYYPFLANENAKGFPNYNPNQMTLPAYREPVSTDGDGRFRVIGLPGRGLLAAKSLDRSYRLGVGAGTIPERPSRQSMRLEALPTYDQIHPDDFQAIAGIDPPLDQPEFHQDLQLERSPSLVVHLVDPQGQPLAGAEVWGRFVGQLDQGNNSLWDSDTRVVVDPKASKTVTFFHRERKLASALIVKPGDEGGEAGRTVMLQPCAIVTGRLVDAGGKPTSGVISIQPSGKDDLRSGIHHPDVVPDENGRFRIDDLPPTFRFTIRAKDRSDQDEPDGPRRFQTFDLASNRSFEPGQQVDLGTFEVTKGRRVEVAKAESADVPITGRVIDLEGRPVAGVSVTVENFLVPKAGDLMPWLEEARKGGPPHVAYRHIDREEKPSGAAARGARTDRDGRFRIEGLGAERVVGLALQGDSIARTAIDVVTRRMDSFQAPGFANWHGPGSCTIYGADFTYTVAPGRPVEGVVKDAKTGLPLKDAEVRSYRFAGSTFVGIMTIRTRTDDQGRFRLTGLPKGKGNKLIIVPNDEQPYLMQEVELPDEPGAGPIKIDVALMKGVWIEGTLTEQGTGKPIPGAWLHYLPFRENSFAQAHPAFHSGGYTDGTGFQDRYLTKADGTFRLVGLPGRAIVGAISYDKGGKTYLQGAGSEAIEGLNKYGHFLTYSNPIIPGKLWPTAMKEIRPEADAEVVKVDLQVRTGPSVRLKVIDSSGQPVAGASTRGLTGRGSYERQGMAAAEGEVANLMPDEERIVAVWIEARKVGKVARVRKGDDANGPVVVTLEPLAAMTGRVVDAEGRPVQGASVRPDLLPSGDFSTSLPEVTTDEQGRFQVPNMPTGCDYALVVVSNKGPGKDRRFTFLEKATVKPGDTTDVGEIRFKDD